MPSNLLPSVANHLWQSTLFAACAGVVALILRHNEGRIRYWVWFAASLKLLVPFSLLIDFGSRVARPALAAPTAGLSFRLDTLLEPFSPAFAGPTAPSAPIQAMSASASETLHLGEFLAAIWLCGCAVVLLRWIVAQRRLASLKRISMPLTGGHEYETVQRLKGVMGIQQTVRVMCTATPVEPGVIGLFNPVLLLPETLTAEVSDEEFEAIVAHELAHIWRGDNRSATIQMFIATVFWFYPVVWWLKSNLMKERERACDEAVLKLGTEPRAYAEAILKICEFCLRNRSPFCMSAVSGANLKKRVEEIMTHPVGEKLNLVRRMSLIAAAGAALSIPFFVGLMSPELSARSQATERLAFEVASVKPSAPVNDPRQIMQAMALQYLPGGRFSARGVPVPVLIFEAFGVAPGPSGRISLSPEFQKSLDPKMESETYDIDAVAEKDAIPANASPSLQRERIRLMLQTLLSDRFKVRMRRETKEMPVYGMVVGKGGVKLQESAMDVARCTVTSTDKPQFIRLAGAADPTSCHAFSGGPRPGLRGQAIDMKDLAAVVERFSDRPVLDQTGLSGLYKIDLPGWETRESSLTDPGRPTFSEVLQNLGLRLESTKASVEVFVVEHFERPVQQ